MAGFLLKNTESQGDVTGKVKTFDVPSSNGDNLGIGDVVVITGDADSTTGRQQVAKGVASTANTGIVVGIEPTYAGEALSRTHLPSSTAGKLRVNVDPGALYEVDVTGSNLGAADAGLNVPLDNTAGTVSEGLYTSNMAVDGSSAATTSTLPFRIVQILEDDSGTYGAKAIVRVNESTSQLGATGIS